MDTIINELENFNRFHDVYSKVITYLREIDKTTKEDEDKKNICEQIMDFLRKPTKDRDSIIFSGPIEVNELLIKIKEELKDTSLVISAKEIKKNYLNAEMPKIDINRATVVYIDEAYNI